jgi:pimeloyl-[acyl-carrier protein] methyl ester esterase
LHVDVRGTGPDLVLLHGWALHGGMWGPWLDRLAEHHRLHVVDLPGHGHSAWSPAITDLVGLARAIAPALPRDAAILGWSLGGMIALELARLQPQHVGPLALIATTPRFLAGSDWDAGLRPEVLAGFAQGIVDDYQRTVRTFLALQTHGDENATATLRLLRNRLTTRSEPDARALEAGLQILRTTDLRAALPHVTQPTLVLAGEYDRLTPPQAGRELASALPAAEFTLVERAGHAPFLSHADAVLAELLPFLARGRKG